MTCTVTSAAVPDIMAPEKLIGCLSALIGDVYAKTGESWTADPYNEVYSGTKTLYRKLLS